MTKLNRFGFGSVICRKNRLATRCRLQETFFHFETFDFVFIAALQDRNENATQVFLKTAPEIATVVQKADEYDRFLLC